MKGSTDDGEEDATATSDVFNLGDRAGSRSEYLNLFLSEDDDNVVAKAKATVGGALAVVTKQHHLQEGLVVYVGTRVGRKPHRVLSLRAGLRSRDPCGLRIGELAEIVG